MLRELGYYSRMARGVVQVLRAPLPSDPEEFIRGRLFQRESVFLEMVRRTIFCDDGHPYYRMFQLAGCDFGDLANQCGREGMEATLLRLRQEGVYLSHDEWKGKVPIVRSGREIPASTASFRNPLVDGWLGSLSSGSTGRPVRTARSTAALVHTSVYQMLRGQEFSPDGSACWIDVKPILPAPVGLNSVLRGKRTGTPTQKWFSAGGAFLDHGHYRTLTRAMVLIGNAFGAGAPYPSYLPFNDFSPVRGIPGPAPRGRPRMHRARIRQSAGSHRRVRDRYWPVHFRYEFFLQWRNIDPGQVQSFRTRGRASVLKLHHQRGRKYR